MNSELKLSAFAVLMVLSGNAIAGTIIQCLGEDGSITFADTRCPGDQQQVSKKNYSSSKTTEFDTTSINSAPSFPEGDPIPSAVRYRFQAQFAQLLASTASLKQMMLEFYYFNGQWPRRLQDLGVDPSTMTSSLIESTEVADHHGSLRFVLKKSMGENKQLLLKPVPVMGGNIIEWHCYTSFPDSWLKSPAAPQALCQSKQLDKY